MNRLILIVAFLLAAACRLTAQTDSAPVAAEESAKGVYPRWSVVGEWRVTHPDWTDILTLKADGTLVTSRQGATGRWILTADGGTPLLVFRWDEYGTESVAMVTPNHFRGQVGSERFMDMRRGEEHGE